MSPTATYTPGSSKPVIEDGGNRPPNGKAVLTVPVFSAPPPTKLQAKLQELRARILATSTKLSRNNPKDVKSARTLVGVYCALRNLYACTYGSQEAAKMLLRDLGVEAARRFGRVSAWHRQGSEKYKRWKKTLR
jgi:hypothetical protein